MIISQSLLDTLSAQAKANSRLRQAYDLQGSENQKSMFEAGASYDYGRMIGSYDLMIRMWMSFLNIILEGKLHR